MVRLKSCTFKFNFAIILFRFHQYLYELKISIFTKKISYCIMVWSHMSFKHSSYLWRISDCLKSHCVIFITGDIYENVPKDKRYSKLDFFLVSFYLNNQPNALYLRILSFLSSNQAENSRGVHGGYILMTDKRCMKCQLNGKN